MTTLRIRRIGRADYEPTWRAMQAFTDQRDGATDDELWLVEHPPVFTQGQSGKAEHVLAPGDIPVIQVDRGGQVTYHGPGQIVAYPLVDLKRLGVGVRDFVHRIEEAIIRVLARYGVEGERVEGAPGIYVDGDKIASLGLRVRRACTFHGLAFNIDMDLEPFGRINPCGFAGLRVIRLRDLAEVEFGAVEDHLVEELAEQFGHDEVIDREGGAV
ncbi:MAG: lipoyl(octanoyl) transferase LipB [Gammaproteobacteria bacterium]|nr:lipoyl(octanoyl) transferase LipB [Gammaproteobacteria bacterium]MBT8057879.1 lipoyl(octanoyl) transferase LipB [Gammaproteobacteria bacterium]